MTAVIHTGDALAVLRTLPEASVHCCVTDPPYGERAASWDDPKTAEWHEGWLREANRVVVPDGPFIVFGSRRYLDILMGAMRRVLGDTASRPMQTGAWVHRQGMTNGNAGFLRAEHEPFVCSGRLRVTAEDVRFCREYSSPHNVQRKQTNRRSARRGFKEFTYTPHEAGPMAGTIIEASRNKGAEATGHPTQKPIGLMGDLVVLACDVGETVLDPFTGSGTTGVAAVHRGRAFVGIELSPIYAKMAKRRIDQEAPLFVKCATQQAPPTAQQALEPSLDDSAHGQQDA